MMTKSKYIKYRYKMQQKFNELFGIKEKGEMEMRRYKTVNFFRQILLCNLEGIRIVNYKKLIEIDEEEITFEFEDALNEEVDKIINDCKSGLYKDKRLDNFEEMKVNRKKMIKEFLFK